MLGIYLLISICLLFLGAKYFVKASVNLALYFHIKPYLIALTVIAFATSMPELIATCIAQMKTDQADMALGNVIGSNIANIGLVLGLCSLIRPIKIEKSYFNKDFTHLLISSLVFAFFLYKGSITRIDGGLLFLLFLAIYFYHIYTHRKTKEKASYKANHLVKTLCFLVGSFLLLFFGAELLINQSILMARYLSISERVVGLFLVAVGTSIPELAISLLAAIEKKEEVSLGNIIGSNLFNTLFIISIASFVRPMLFSKAFFQFDLPVMLFFTLLLWAMAYFRSFFAKKEGGVLLFFYLCYIGILFF